MKKKSSLRLLTGVLIITIGQLSAQNQIKQVDDFLKELKGSFKPVVNEYSGTDLKNSQIIDKGTLKINSGDWNCNVTAIKNNNPELTDVKVVFQLKNGTAKETAV